LAKNRLTFGLLGKFLGGPLSFIKQAITAKQARREACLRRIFIISPASHERPERLLGRMLGQALSWPFFSLRSSLQSSWAKRTALPDIVFFVKFRGSLSFCFLFHLTAAPFNLTSIDRRQTTVDCRFIPRPRPLTLPQKTGVSHQKVVHAEGEDLRWCFTPAIKAVQKFARGRRASGALAPSRDCFREAGVLKKERLNT
jgi:hypothetical protein